MKLFFYRLFFYLKSTRRKVKNSNNIYKLFMNKNILEVGGPSRFFKKNIPIYQLARNIDGVNFSNQTFWEGDLKNNSKYHYFKNKHGKQFLSEASELNINTIKNQKM
mgnify:CR=1 FL=1